MAGALAWPSTHADECVLASEHMRPLTVHVLPWPPAAQWQLHCRLWVSLASEVVSLEGSSPLESPRLCLWAQCSTLSQREPLQERGRYVNSQVVCWSGGRANRPGERTRTQETQHVGGSRPACSARVRSRDRDMGGATRSVSAKGRSQPAGDHLKG